MKKITAFFTAAFVTLSFSSCSLSALFLPFVDEYERRMHAENTTRVLLSGDFFDEETMQKIRLEWLEKPSGAQNESFYSLPYKVEYTCYMSSTEAIQSHFETVFREFTTNDYLLGHSLEGLKDNNLSSFRYKTVILSNTIEDFAFGEPPCYYDLYYSADGTKRIPFLDKVCLIFPMRLTAYWNTQPNEEDLYKYTMIVESKTSNPICMRKAE